MPGLADRRSNLANRLTASWSSRRSGISEPDHGAGAPELDALRNRFLGRRVRSVAAKQDEFGDPVRIGRGEQRAHRRSLGKPKQHGLLRPDIIHDGANVVDPLLQRRRVGYPVGQTLASFVEGDDAGEVRQPAQEGRIARNSCRNSTCESDAGHQDDVDRSVAHGLIGNVDIAAERRSGSPARRNRSSASFPQYRDRSSLSGADEVNW